LRVVYSPQGRRFTVHLDKVGGANVKAWWYNPRTGGAQAIDDFDKTDKDVKPGKREMQPPSEGFGSDWVLVLDDATKKFPPPGGKR
jgi:hypothetical protein